MSQETVLPETMYCWKFASGTAEISREELSGLLAQVESELRSSPLYRQVVDNLQKLPADIGNHVQQMVNAIGKAGVQLALRKVITKKVEIAEPIPAAHDLNHRGVEGAIASCQAPLPDMERRRRSAVSSVTLAETPKRLNKKQRVAQVALEAWRDRLGEIGQELQQARQTKALSLHQLHFKTQIPVHRLKNLEAGTVEPFIEDDIYLRGFIRRAGDALGLDGAALADSLPSPVPTHSILPSWERSPHRAQGLHLGRAYLYVGYAALLTSGMSWLSYQTTAKPASQLMTEPIPTRLTPNPPIETKTGAETPDQVDSASVSNSNAKLNAKLNAKPGQSKAQRSIVSNVAPPEKISPLTSSRSKRLDGKTISTTSSTTSQ
jgi:cytoskeleton protein RodZ